MSRENESRYMDNTPNEWVTLYLAANDTGVSQREFCTYNDIPRSTLQGWIKAAGGVAKATVVASAVTTPKVNGCVISVETKEVLCLLVNELNAVVTDLEEIIDSL